MPRLYLLRVLIKPVLHLIVALSITFPVLAYSADNSFQQRPVSKTHKPAVKAARKMDKASRAANEHNQKRPDQNAKRQNVRDGNERNGENSPTSLTVSDHAARDVGTLNSLKRSGIGNVLTRGSDKESASKESLPIPPLNDLPLEGREDPFAPVEIDQTPGNKKAKKQVFDRDGVDIDLH